MSNSFEGRNIITKPDHYLKEDIKNILSNGYTDENPRPKYKDGMPAHTYFVTHNIRTYDLSKGEFPICTLRPIAWRNAIKEVLWMFQDKSNSLNLLEEKYGIKWWRDWESKEMQNTIGCRYGHTVSQYDLFNKRVLEDIKSEPYGRYHICNLWQEEELLRSDGLKPCAYETIWTVHGEFLDMFLNQRSGDMLVASGAGGVNEVQYAALLMMVARHTGYKPGKFTHSVINEQIYDRHITNAEELLTRTSIKQKPRLLLNETKRDFYAFTINDFILEDYYPIKPQLKFELGI